MIHLLQQERGELDQLLDVWEEFVSGWMVDVLQDAYIDFQTVESLGLPAPLVRAYLIGLEQLEGGQDQLLPTEDLETDGDHLIFAAENQCVWEAAIIPEEDNPTVWFGDPKNGWENTGSSLVEFLITWSLQECVFCCEFTSGELGLRERLTQRKPEAMQVLWSNGPMFHAPRSFWLFSNDILLMEFADGKGASYGCRNEESFEEHIVNG